MNIRRTTCWLFFLVLSAQFATACSGKPQRDDDVLTEETQTETVPSADSLIGDDGQSAMPSADDLESTGGSAAEGTNVSSGVASDIRDAIAAAKKGDKNGAAEELADLVDRPDGGFLAAYNLGVVRERQGLYEKAAKRYYQSVQKNPDFTPALDNLARLYLRQGQASDAERIVQKFVNQRPDNLDHRAVLLLVQLQKGAYEDVVRNAKQLLRKDERHVGAMLALAEANFELSRYELAKSVIVQAVQLQPERAELYNLYGLIELELGNKPAAIANFRKAIELRPQYPEAHNNLGVLYHEARDYASAEAEFRAAVDDYPDYKQAYLNLGNAYKGSARYKDAELAFKKAIGIDGQYADAHFNLGILYLDSEVPGIDTITRLQKAIDAFNQYKTAARGQRSKDDPADKYIEEAKKAIEVERQKQEMMREAQMGAEQTE